MKESPTPDFTKGEPMRPTSKGRKAEKIEEPKKVKWLTRAMAEDFTRHDILLTTLIEAVLYLIFVSCVTTYTYGSKSPYLFYMTKALTGQFIKSEFTTANDVGIDYNDIKSATDFWKYAESLMLNSLYWEQYYDSEEPVADVKKFDRAILFENKLLGVPRIRQVKVKNDSCIIHAYFRRLFLTCYDLYREEDEDRDLFGPGDGTAWNYNLANETKSITYSGTVSSYGGGGFYIDLAETKNGSAKIIKDLKENLWITRGTRAVFVDFSVYNVNVNLFCICKLVFEFPPTGGVLPSHSFKTVRLIRFLDTWDYVSTFCECIVYIICLFYLIEEIREIMYFRVRYLLQFWTYIDIVIIVIVGANLISVIMILTHAPEAIDLIKENPDEYGNLEYVGNLQVFYNNFGATLLFFSYVKIFKYLNFNKTMGQLNNTLKRCALDILGFSIMFFIIFFAFAELGYLLFGSQVQDFSSFGVAMFTLLRTILGDFDYIAIEKANKILAPIYFLSYIFFVFFVLLNMFLAIINDTYADVKTEIAIAPDEMQMTEFLKQGFYNLLQKCGCNITYFQKQRAEFNATIQQIRDALGKCGFSDHEIETFFERYNIDPTSTDTGAYDVKKIIKELEDQSGGKDKTDEEAALIHISDFLTRKERLDEIEKSIKLLLSKIDILMRKLDEMEKWRKNKAQG